VNPNLHRFAILVAICALLLVVSGAVVTTEKTEASDYTPMQPLHQIVAVAVCVLALGLAVWLMIARSFWIAGMILVTAGITGGLGSAPPSPNGGTLHATLAQIFFAVCWAAVVVTSKGWAERKEPVPDSGWPSLRSLAVVMPVLVLIQVGMGAAFRHKAMEVMPHLVGAMVVALLILCNCLFVTQPYPKHPTLRPAANLLLAITCIQVFLGIAVFTVLLVNTASATVLLASTAAHVSVGAMTLAATLGLSLLIRRTVFPKPPEE
jgi:hypothetical protein